MCTFFYKCSVFLAQPQYGYLLVWASCYAYVVLILVSYFYPWNMLITC